MAKPLKLLCGPSAWHGFGMSGGKKIRDTYFVENVFDLIIKEAGEKEVVVNTIGVGTLEGGEVNFGLSKLDE